MGTALIVEDHPDQAQMVAGLLRFRNFDPIVAGTGEAGLKLARERTPDVVILDLMLPDISGFDVCRQLRSDRATMLTPIVMLTALGDATNRVQGFRVGANAYVTKPYGMQELIEAINAARAWRSHIEAAEWTQSRERIREGDGPGGCSLLACWEREFGCSPQVAGIPEILVRASRTSRLPTRMHSRASALLAMPPVLVAM